MYLLAQLGLCRVVQVGQWHHPLITHKDPTHSIVSWWPLLHNTCHDLKFPSITNDKRMAPHKTSKTERVVNYKHATSQVRNIKIEAWTVRIYNDRFVCSSKAMDFLFRVVVFTTLIICLFFKLSTCAIKLKISCYLMVSSFIQRATSCCFTSWFVCFFSHQLQENRSSTKADEGEGAIWRTRKAFRSIHKCKACYRLKDLHMVNHGIHEQWLHNPLHHSHSIVQAWQP